MSAHRFSHEFAKELLKALGLEGHHVRRIEMVFDVNEAVTAKVYEFADFDRSVQLVRVLEMGEWHADVSTATDLNRQWAKP